MAIMSLLHILNTTICSTFMIVCGKCQYKKPVPSAFVLDFSLSVDSGKEDGYRHLMVVLYARHNYVSVYTRETWDVIPVEDLDYNEEDACRYVKPGKYYQKGATPWKLIASHDSCWEEVVREVLQDPRLNYLTTRGDSFYQLVNPALLGLPESN